MRHAGTHASGVLYGNRSLSLKHAGGVRTVPSIAPLIKSLCYTDPRQVEEAEPVGRQPDFALCDHECK